MKATKDTLAYLKDKLDSLDYSRDRVVGGDDDELNAEIEEVKEMIMGLEKQQDTKCIIVGCVDDETPNASIFFESTDKAKVQGIYEKLLRLNDLSFPTTKALKDEHDTLYHDLQEDGVEIFGEEAWIDDTPFDWTLTGIYLIEAVQYEEVDDDGIRKDI